MTWPVGAERIRDLLDAGELELVEPSDAVARHLLERYGADPWRFGATDYDTAVPFASTPLLDIPRP